MQLHALRALPKRHQHRKMNVLCIYSKVPCVCCHAVCKMEVKDLPQFEGLPSPEMEAGNNGLYAATLGMMDQWKMFNNGDTVDTSSGVDTGDGTGGDIIGGSGGSDTSGTFAFLQRQQQHKRRSSSVNPPAAAPNAAAAAPAAAPLLAQPQAQAAGRTTQNQQQQQQQLKVKVTAFLDVKARWVLLDRSRNASSS